MSEPCTYLDVVIPQTSGSQYTHEQKISAATQYVSVGNINRLSQMVGMPQRTLEDWTKTEWWHELTTRIREEKKPEYDAMFSRLIETSAQVIEKQLKKGNVKARDAATIMGISFDKRQILNNQPTNISSNIGSKELDKLRQLFEEQALKTIDGTTV